MENQNKTNEEYVNLISRLKARFHNNKIAKKIAGLILAGAITLAPIGCSKDNSPNNVTDTTNNKNSNQQTEQTEQNQTTENENNSQYSQMLLNVLNDEHYNALIQQAKTNAEIYKRGEFKPHPYAFLEDEGFDTSAIMNGQLDCFTMSYVKPEEPTKLYMFTRVTEGEYVSNYLLKYNLTEKEMHDYNLMHSGEGNKNYFLQAVFLNNEISQLKTPTIVGESKMEKEAFDGMTKTMQGRGYASTNKCDIIMTNPVKETYLFDLKIIPRPTNENEMAFSYNISELTCKGNLVIENGVYRMPYTFGGFRIEEETKNQKIQYYFTQNAKLNAFYFKDLLQ